MDRLPCQNFGSNSDHVYNSKSNTQRSESSFKLQYRSLSISSDVEDVEWYKPGGYCPVDVGDVIHDRFKVADKLGYGGIATVWLCLDLQNSKWRALKINSSSHSSEDCADLKAIKLLGDQPHQLKELEENHIMVALETFFLDSPNGRHLCSVLPVAGPSYAVWEERIYEDFKGEEKLSYKRKICHQLTKGLAFLHQKGICHGDFRPGNILMKLKPGCLDQLGYDEMIDLLGSEAVGEILLDDDKRSPHAPKYACLSIECLYGRLSELVSGNIVIVDFGEAYEVSTPPEKLDIPHSYAGPEWLLGKQTGIGNDIWSWGYTMAEVMGTGSFPRSFWKIIRRMERFIGPVPAAYGPRALRLLQREHGFRGFDGIYGPHAKLEYQENEPVTGPTTEFINLQEQVEAERRSDLQHPIHTALDAGEEMSRDEILLMGDLLGKIFKYDPDERIRVTEALGHPWFEYTPGAIVDLPHTLEDEWLKRKPPRERAGSKPSASGSSESLEEPRCLKEAREFKELREPKIQGSAGTSTAAIEPRTFTRTIPAAATPTSTSTSEDIPSETPASSSQPSIKEKPTWGSRILPWVIMVVLIICIDVLCLYWHGIIWGELPSQCVKVEGGAQSQGNALVLPCGVSQRMVVYIEGPSCY